MIDLVVSQAEPADEIAKGNYRIVARFNLAISGVAFINGCVLVHRSEKGWTIWGPGRDVKFTSKARRHIKLALMKKLQIPVPAQMLP